MSAPPLSSFARTGILTASGYRTRIPTLIAPIESASPRYRPRSIRRSPIPIPTCCSGYNATSIRPTFAVTGVAAACKTELTWYHAGPTPTRASAKLNGLATTPSAALQPLSFRTYREAVTGVGYTDRIAGTKLRENITRQIQENADASGHVTNCPGKLKAWELPRVVCATAAITIDKARHGTE